MQAENPGDLEQAVIDYQSTGDQECLDRVVEAGKRLVYHFANLYAPRRPGEDLIQVGFEGLLKAVARFDPGRGVAFNTYASHCIMGEMRHLIRKEASFDRAGWAAELQSKVQQVVEDRLKKTGEAPSISEIAAAVNVREEGVIEAMRAGWVTLNELEISRVQSQRYESFCLPIEDKIVLEQAMNKLSSLQSKVIKLLFYRDLTQTEAAAELGVSQRQVSRLLRQSLDRLAKAMTLK